MFSPVTHCQINQKICLQKMLLANHFGQMLRRSANKPFLLDRESGGKIYQNLLRLQEEKKILGIHSNKREKVN